MTGAVMPRASSRDDLVMTLQRRPCRFRGDNVVGLATRHITSQTTTTAVRSATASSPRGNGRAAR